MKIIHVKCRVKNYIAELCTGIAEVKGSNHVQARFLDLLFATAKVAYITEMIFIHIIQIIIVNTQALWFHDIFYDQNRLLLAHAFNILSPNSCFLKWWPCSHLLLHYTYLHFTWLRYVFCRQVRKFNSEFPLLKKSKLTQLDCLSHFILKGIQFTG